MKYTFIIIAFVSLLLSSTAFQMQPPQQAPKRSAASMNVQSIAAPPEKRTLAAAWPALGLPDHALLTKAQEQKLGRAIQKARKLQQWIEQTPQNHQFEPDDPAAAYRSSAKSSHELFQNYTQAQIDVILERGHRAKQTLIVHNLKLVSGIAKKWALMTHNNNREYTSNAFEGSLTRPSLQEAIQEGIVGLSKAADRYEPDRNWKFSTYATYWITASIRTCYSRASTGHAMRLPSQYYETLGKYKSLLKEQYHNNLRAPPLEDLASEMNINLSRLQQIIRLTQPPLSLDSPSRAFASAGKSGIADQSDGILGDNIIMDNEDDPEALVERSLLRQALEHALATELAPHERDVVRLRLGLDDGVTRTCRRVAEECFQGRLRTVDIQVTWNRALKKLRSPQALSQYQWLSYLELCDVDQETVSLR